jgi:hypothetical protein
MICSVKGLFACTTSRATINVPPDQCYERVLAQAFWVLHCLSQMSEYMRTIATLPLATASLILGLRRLVQFLLSLLCSRTMGPRPCQREAPPRGVARRGPQLGPPAGQGRHVGLPPHRGRAPRQNLNVLAVLDLTLLEYIIPENSLRGCAGHGRPSVGVWSWSRC